ncbi:MAG TPA: hypothetical protein PLP65_03410 [Bacteroidales bacterium]|nr:hypothetical protein [Bacteroidales bacterium]
MKKSDIYEIVIKIIGLYLFIKSIENFKEVIFYFTAISQKSQSPDIFGGIDQKPYLFISIGHLLLTLFIAIIFIFKTKVITALISKKDDYIENTAVSFNKKIIYEVSLTLAGLIIIIWSLPEFAIKLKNHIYLVKNNFSTNSAESEYIIITAIKLLIALIIIIYSKSISLFLSKESKK